jgi:hypothetical protein
MLCGERDSETTSKQRILEKGSCGWIAGPDPCEILKEKPHRFLVRLGEVCVLPRGRQAEKGEQVYVPKDALERVAEPSMEATIEERV